MLNKVSFSDWVDLFRLVADYKPDEKKVLVIDEFPYLVKTNPALWRTGSLDSPTRSRNLKLLLIISVLTVKLSASCQSIRNVKCSYLKSLSVMLSIPTKKKLQRLLKIRYCLSSMLIRLSR